METPLPLPRRYPAANLGKGTHHCFHRWYKVLNPNRSKKRWTLNDDLILVIGQFIYRKRNGKAYLEA